MILLHHDSRIFGASSQTGSKRPVGGGVVISKYAALRKCSNWGNRSCNERFKSFLFSSPRRLDTHFDALLRAIYLLPLEHISENCHELHFCTSE